MFHTVSIFLTTLLFLQGMVSQTHGKIAKNYAAGAGESRQYRSGGLLEKVTLARGGFLVLGYSADGAKDLTTATWPQVTSDSFTIPAAIQSYGYDRAGRVDEIAGASGARSLIYQKGRLKETAWTAGPLAGYKIVRGIDEFGRQTGFELWRGNDSIHTATQIPNGVSGEISNITASGFNAVLGRDPVTRNLTSSTRGAVIQNWPRPRRAHECR